MHIAERGGAHDHPERIHEAEDLFPARIADLKADDGAIEISWKQAVLKKDVPAMDKLLHADLIYSHSDAHIQTKADILKDMGNTQDIKFGDTSVRVYGGTALLKGPMEVISKAADGSTSSAKISVLQVWLKGKQGWQLVGRHATRLPAAP